MISNSTSPFRSYNRNTIATPKKSPIRASLSSSNTQPNAIAHKSPIKMTIVEQTQLRMRNELALILKELQKSEQILNDKSIPFQKKQLVDPDKWRKKFRFLFDREKCINFDAQEGSHIFAKKGIITTLEPKSVKPLGQFVLEELPTFWVLFVFYNRAKIDGDID